MLRQRFARAFMWPWAFAFFMAGLFLPKSLLAKDLPRLRSRVFGYIPYWTASKNTWNFQGLTDIALFSVGANDAGQLTSTSFWRSSQAKTILEEAHKQGVSVELAVTNFDPTSLHNLLSDSAAVDKLIGALVQEAFSTQSGDGLSIDFEGLRGADRAVFVSFVTKLRAAMKKVRADSRLSLATPAVDWSKAYDYAALAAQSDTLFIMGYGYHYSGSSNPGPVAPLNCGAPWGNYCLSATVANYLNIVGEAGRGKIVLGLPLYGYDYPADSDKIGAKSLGTGQAVFYSAARKQVKNRRYEPVSESPWYVYTDAKGQLHQVFYDDEESLGKKLDFVLGQNLSGSRFLGAWVRGRQPLALGGTEDGPSGASSVAASWAAASRRTKPGNAPRGFNRRRKRRAGLFYAASIGSVQKLRMARRGVQRERRTVGACAEQAASSRTPKHPDNFGKPTAAVAVFRHFVHVATRSLLA